MRNPFKIREKRQTLEEILINGGVLTNSVSKAQALNIPAVSACVELIATTVASLPIKLYEETGETTKSTSDSRVDLINDDTKDTMDGFQFKHALVEDYLLHGGGYAYINRARNDVKSLHYVDNLLLAITTNTDPIYKSAQMNVMGESFREFQFVKLLRKSKNGVTGKGVIKENNVILSVAYNAMVFEEIMVKTGGNKRGFLKSQGRLSKEAMDELKGGWKNLYANTNNNNVMVLNNGLEFQEASQTSVELQLNEHKTANSDQICKLFLVPPSLLSGEAKEEEYNNWIKVCILPILAAFEIALNKDLLLPSEKGNKYFAFDTTELTKADIQSRFKAYEIGIKGGFMQIDEVRYKENLSPLNLNWLKLGLQDVLYFSDSNEIYTPNTNKLAKMGDSPVVQPNGGVPNEGISNSAGLDQNTGQSTNNGQAG